MQLTPAKSADLRHGPGAEPLEKAHNNNDSH